MFGGVIGRLGRVKIKWNFWERVNYPWRLILSTQQHGHNVTMAIVWESHVIF